MDENKKEPILIQPVNVSIRIGSTKFISIIPKADYVKELFIKIEITNEKQNHSYTADKKHVCFAAI